MTRPVLLDVDTGCDDAVMTAMALGSPAVEVVGITTVAGNSTVDNTTHNTLALLELLDRDVPVAAGAEGPIVDDLFTAEAIHGEGGIRGEMPQPSAEPVDDHAVQFTIERAHEYGDDLTIVAVGPLTNLAAALVQEPSLPGIVDEIHVMGGTATTAGNRTPAAEANFRNDPVAARRVVATASPYVAGLDACHHATVPQSLIDEYRASDPPLRQVGAWMDYPEWVRSVGPTDQPIIHDAVVVADLIDGVLTHETHPLAVDTSEGPSRGALIADQYRVGDGEPNGHLAVDVDTEQFRATLRESIGRL